MGVRLYPNTLDRKKLELLIGVPEGTYDRLEATLQRHQAVKDANQDVKYEQWKEIYEDKYLGALDHFLTFGWGKFKSVNGIGEDYSGKENNLQKANELLLANGIKVDVELTEGVHWC